MGKELTSIVDCFRLFDKEWTELNKNHISVISATDLEVIEVCFKGIVLKVWDVMYVAWVKQLSDIKHLRIAIDKLKCEASDYRDERDKLKLENHILKTKLSDTTK